MEVYLLDKQLAKVAVIDDYTSFVFTERYDVFGDFVLEVPATRENRLLFNTDMYVIHSETTVPMIIDYRDVQTDDEGDQKLIVKGKDLKVLLDQRSVIPNKGLEWRAKVSIGGGIVSLVKSICVDATGLSPYDKIPELYANNDTGLTTFEDVSIKVGSLYKAVLDLAKSEQCGLKITMRSTSPRLRFAAYRGVEKPKVMFTSSLDYFFEHSNMVSNENYKNVAYVWGKDNLIREIVTLEGKPNNVEGVNRRVLSVDASDIDPTGLTEAVHRSQLKRRGREALAEHARLKAFDGEVVMELAPYKYNVDYALGDIVSKINDFDVRELARVTEYIVSSDAEGIKAYPTLVDLDS